MFKYKIKRFLILLLLCAVDSSISIAGNQQNLAAELANVTKAYLNAENFSAAVETVVFKNQNDKTGESIGKGVLKKTKAGHYSSYATFEMIANKTCTLIVNHADKKMTYVNTLQRNKQKTSFAPELPVMDTLLNMADSVKFNGEVKGVKQYTFYRSSSEIHTMEVYVNTKTNFVTRLVYYYDTTNPEADYGIYKAVVYYNNISTNAISAETFSEKKYLVYTNDKKQQNPALKPEYKNYKLIVTKNNNL